MRSYVVDVIHKVHASYRVEATDENHAVERLCDKGLFAEYSGNTFGPCESVLESEQIELLQIEADGDPSPSGRTTFRRAWEISEEVE